MEVGYYRLLERGSYAVVVGDVAADEVYHLYLGIACSDFVAQALKCIFERLYLGVRNVADIAERSCDYVIQADDDGELYEKRTASAGGVEVFRLVHIHGFLLHLLLSSLVGSSGILFADSRDFRCKRRLLNLVLLLFYGDRSQKQLYYKCKEKYRRQVVVCEGIRKSQYIAHRYIQDIENTFH